MTGVPRPKKAQHPELAGRDRIPPERELSPQEITESLLDLARDDRLTDWEDSEPDVVEAIEAAVDISFIALIWDAAWNAAIDAVTTLGGLS